MPTTNVKPDGDVTTNWDTTTGATHWDEINELVSAPTDASYIETTTLDDDDEFTLENTPTNTDEVTSIELHVRAQIDDTAGTAYIRLNLSHSGGTPVTGNPKDVSQADCGGDGVLGNVTKTWSGLSLTKAQADSLQLETIFKKP